MKDNLTHQGEIKTKKRCNNSLSQAVTDIISVVRENRKFCTLMKYGGCLHVFVCVFSGKIIRPRSNVALQNGSEISGVVPRAHRRSTTQKEGQVHGHTHEQKNTKTRESKNTKTYELKNTKTHEPKNAWTQQLAAN